MWVKRTPDEIAKSVANAKSDALMHGLMIGGMAWAIATAVLSSGWLVSLRLGIAVQQGDGSNFWRRLPISALISLPFAAIAFWYERRKAIAKDMRRTICLKCELIGEFSAGSTCPCGGEIVQTKSVKWIENDKDWKHA